MPSEHLNSDTVGLTDCPDSPASGSAEIARAVVDRAVQHDTHQRLLDIWKLIEPDKYLLETMGALELAIAQRRSYWDLCCALAAYAELYTPATYLEIGVRRGRSAAVVAAVCPDVELHLFDMWYPNYANVPNPGPEFVRAQLHRVGHRGAVHVHSGRSQETVPNLFAGRERPNSLNLVTVDGDHRDAGALADLENVVSHIGPGGMMAFDDIAHPDFPTLHRTWQAFLCAHPGLSALENLTDATGTAIAIALAPINSRG